MVDKRSKETLREEVKKHIIKGIGDGTYKYGERIVETKLAKELQVSQAPVREAILELSIQGVLEERPYAGSFVRKPDAGELDDHYKVRILTESYNASEAAKTITEEELQNMRFILHEMSECENVDEFVELDHSFHRLIVDASRNNVLKRIWVSLSVYETTYQAILTNRWTLKDLFELHRRLYEAVASGDPNSAAAEMYLHIYKFRIGVLEDMKQKAEVAESDKKKKEK